MAEKDNRSKQEITIYDVAKEADVSLATVSRVINNSAVVRPERRKRVEEAIAKLNFVPNEIARGLARKSSTSIGVIVPDMRREEVTELLAGIIDTANLKQYGYAVSINSYLGNEDTFQKYIERMTSSQMDGLLIMCDYVSEQMYKVLKQVKIPLVLFCTPNELKDIYSIAINYQQVGKDIAAYYQSQNYKHITLFARETESETTGMIASFIKSYREIGQQVEVIKLNGDYDKSYDYFKRTYAKNTIPQGVLTTNDTLALAFSNAMQDLNFQVPEQVEIISFSNTSLALSSRPMLTSVMYPVYRMGAYAMSLVTKLIKDMELSQVPNLQNDYQIIWRGSTKKK